MIFAIYDHIHYLGLEGRYTPFQSSKLETWCYYDFIPEKTLKRLEVGDVILAGNYHDWLSWLIMYLTDSIFSHLIIYDADGFVAHMTLSGYRYQGIQELFGPEKRFLPTRLRAAPFEPTVTQRMSGSLKNMPARRYGYARPILVGLSYLLCLNPFGFHMRQFGDLCYCFAVVAILISIFTLPSWIFWTLGFGYLLSVFGYQVICRAIFGHPFFAGTPEHIWRLCEYGQFSPLLNIEGFQKYMMSLADVLRKRHGDLVPGHTYPVPEGFGAGSVLVTSLSDSEYRVFRPTE
jgi:hypothetical protein